MVIDSPVFNDIAGTGRAPVFTWHGPGKRPSRPFREGHPDRSCLDDPCPDLVTRYPSPGTPPGNCGPSSMPVVTAPRAIETGVRNPRHSHPGQCEYPPPCMAGCSRHKSATTVSMRKPVSVNGSTGWVLHGFLRVELPGSTDNHWWDTGMIRLRRPSPVDSTDRFVICVAPVPEGACSRAAMITTTVLPGRGLEMVLPGFGICRVGLYCRILRSCGVDRGQDFPSFSRIAVLEAPGTRSRARTCPP